VDLQPAYARPTYHPYGVIAGIDPAIQPFANKMNARVKPGAESAAMVNGPLPASC